VAVAKTLALVIFGLVFVHSLVLVCWKTQACGPAMFTINQFGYLFDLSREGNIPTWFSVVQLFSVAIALLFLTLTERARGSPVGAWWGLVAIFSYLSLDEATDMHGLWDSGMKDYVIQGMSHSQFTWIIPGAIVVFIVAGLYLKWLWMLPKRTRNLIILAGIVYVSGALVLEGVGGLLADSTFFNTSYLLVSTAEEVLEMYGILIMLYAVLRHLDDRAVRLTIVSSAPAG